MDADNAFGQVMIGWLDTIVGEILYGCEYCRLTKFYALIDTALGYAQILKTEVRE